MSSITFGGYASVLNGDVSITAGIDPDTVSINMTWSDGEFDERDKYPSYGDLVLSDGNTLLTLPECIGNSLTFNRQSSGGGLLSMNLLDYRWRWKYADQITGEYNRRGSDGEFVGEKKTVYQLFGLLTAKLAVPGEWKNDNASKEVYPYVYWEYADTAYALQELASRYGYVICPTFSDGSLSDCTIYSEGSGDIPSEKVLNSYADRDHLIKNSNIIPKTSRLIGGFNLSQVELQLTAVALDTTFGEYYPLTDSENLEYRPTDGWYTGFEEGTVSGATAEENIIYDNIKNEYVFKYYRLPSEITIGEYVYDREEIKRYWSDILCEDFQTIDGKKTFPKGYVKGIYKTEKTDVDKDENQSTEDTIVPVEYEIDKKTGCIKFKERIFDIDDDGQMIGASLTIVCCFELSQYVYDYDSATLISDAYGVVPPVFDDIYWTVRRDDLFTRAVMTYLDDPAEEFPVPSGLVYKDTDEINAKALQRLSDELTPQYYGNLIDGRDILLIGLHAYSPNGNIEEVNISISSAGPTTAIGVGKELSPYVTPRKLREAEVVSKHQRDIFQRLSLDYATKPFITRGWKDEN